MATLSGLTISGVFTLFSTLLKTLHEHALLEVVEGFLVVLHDVKRRLFHDCSWEIPLSVQVHTWRGFIEPYVAASSLGVQLGVSCDILTRLVYLYSLHGCKCRFGVPDMEMSFSKPWSLGKTVLGEVEILIRENIIVRKCLINGNASFEESLVGRNTIYPPVLPVRYTNHFLVILGR